MGWIVSNWTRQELIQELTSRERFSGAKIIKSRMIGNRHWHVVELADGKRFIGLDIISKHGSEYGYKSMDESMGPHYYDCPLSFLALAGEPTGIAADWREDVIHHHYRKDQHKKLRPGSRVRYGNDTFELNRKLNRQSWEVTRERDNGRFKLTPTIISDSQVLSV